MSDFYPIGVASSVAKQFGYSWQKTLEFARKEHLNPIQLYLPQQLTAEHIRIISQLKAEDLYLHLPVKFNKESIQQIVQKKEFSATLFIQHEKYLANDDLDFLQNSSLKLGVENDSDSEVGSFLKFIKRLNERGLLQSAVLDIPRFYKQFHKKNSVESITAEIVKVLKFCSYERIPVIFIIIDSISFSMDREEWTVLFNGLVPWKKIFIAGKKLYIPLKSYLFEYEDYDMVKKSVIALREFLCNV